MSQFAAVGSASGTVGPTGPTGSQGSTGPQGTAGAGLSGINVYNSIATLGFFTDIVLGAGLVGVTGPTANKVTINSTPDFISCGVTGIGFTGSLQVPSGSPLIKWNVQNTGIALGTLGSTNVGTAAQYISINKTAYYSIAYNLQFTGIPSGVTTQSQVLLGATGAPGGTAVANSVAVAYNGFSGAVGNLENAFTVKIPSGTNVSVAVSYLPGGGSQGSPVFLSQTGTFLQLSSVG